MSKPSGRLEGVRSTEVVIIGAGVAGAACAWSLARRGARVTVVDAADDGQATAAGAGIIEPWSSGDDDADPFGALYRAGAEHYGVLLDQLAEVGVSADALGYRANGMLIVGTDIVRLEEVVARCDRRLARFDGGSQLGRVELLGPSRAKATFPPLAPELSAVLVPGGARVDGRMLRDGLLDAARSRGAEVRRARAVLARSANGRVAVKLTTAAAGSLGAPVEGAELQAGTVVVAAGAWTGPLLAPLGHEALVEPQRGQLVHLHLAWADTDRWPAVHAADGTTYLVSFDGGRVVAGATRETGSGFVPVPTAEGVRDVLTGALNMAPGLAPGRLAEIRVGLRPLPVDGCPRIGWLEDGLAICSGFGAGGLTIGPYAGELIAATVLG